MSWVSYVQKSVALSTCEAEYMSLSDASREGMWLKRMAGELGDEHEPFALYEDNQGCIDLTTNASGYRRSRSRHIGTRYHYCRQLVEEGEVTLEYCPTLEMVAAILT